MTLAMVSCLKCGTAMAPYLHSGKRRRYCSKACSMASRAIMSRPSVCGCGETIPPRRLSVYNGKTPTYCSRRCAGKDRSTLRRVEPIGPPSPKRCRNCDSLFSPYLSGQYCSEACRQVRSKDLMWKSYERRRDTDPAFKVRSRVASARYRRALRGISSENIDPIKVFMRDMWMCHLCGQPTIPHARGTTHPLAPELEHIRPLVSGGHHVMSNVRCAHQACNQIKGKRELTPAITERCKRAYAKAIVIVHQLPFKPRGRRRKITSRIPPTGPRLYPLLRVCETDWHAK
jgi:hypothetical protein